MADNFNDIFENYEDKSLEELGSSLLSRQASINEERAKQAKKSRRMGQTLALIGVGQQLFKNAYNKRAKEIDDLRIFEYSNNEQQSKRVSGLANVMSAGFNDEDLKNLAGPDQEWATMSLDEKTEAYMNSSYADILQQKLKGSLDKVIEQVNIFDNPQTFKDDKTLYNGAKKVALKNIVSHYLEGNKYQKFNESIKALTRTPSGEFLSQADALERAMQLTPHQLTRYEQSLFDREKENYRNVGVFEGIKHAFRKVGKRQEEEGGINVFKEIKREDIYGNLDDVIAELDMSANMTTSIEEYMKDIKGTEKDVINQANEDQQGQEALSTFITSFSANQNTRSVYKSKDNPQLAELLQMSGKKGRFEDFWEDVGTNPIEGPAFIRDTLAFEKLIGEKPKLAEAIYESKFEMLYGNKATESDMQNFKNLISDDVYKRNFSIMVMGSEGFKVEKAWYERGKERYDGTGIVGNIQKGYSYDRFSGLIPSLFNDGIKTPSESDTGRFEQDKNWEKLDRKNKILIFDSHYENIDKSKLSNAKKEILIEDLFSNISHPDNLNVEDYKAMRGMTSWEKWKAGVGLALTGLPSGARVATPLTGQAMFGGIEAIKAATDSKPIDFTKKIDLFKELITSPTVKRKEANLKTEIADLEEQNAPEETIEKKKENLFRYQIKNSDNLIVKELLSDEGYRTNVYEDTEGYLTVGIGHKLTEQEKEIYKKGDYVASDIIKKWTTNDITKFSNIAEEGMTEMNLLNSDIYQNHKEKWVSFFYQLGKDGGLKFENMFDAIRQGNGQAAHDEALNSLWAKQTPKRAKRFAKFLKENV
jgi:lysozyme